MLLPLSIPISYSEVSLIANWQTGMMRLQGLTIPIAVNRPYGSTSMFNPTRKWPVCCTPHRNRTITVLPGGIGVPKVTVPTEKLPLKAPPFGCEGGCSSVVPRMVMTEVPVPQGRFEKLSVVSAVVRVRKSAVPDGAGKVVC